MLSGENFVVVKVEDDVKEVCLVCMDEWGVVGFCVWFKGKMVEVILS